MPACLYTSCVACTQACGRTGSRPGKLDGSLLDDVPRIQAGGRPSAAAALATSSLPMMMAQAPSEDGHDSRERKGSHSIGEDFTFSSEMSWIFRWAKGFFSAFWRSLTAT